MRLLVTGAAGMLGRDVVAAAESAGHDVIALARARPRHHRRRRRPRRRRRRAPRRGHQLRRAGPTSTAPRPRRRPRRASTATAPGNLAAAAPFLVHVSSDYVFDGTATEPYIEGDPTGPAPPTAAPSSRASTPSPRPGDARDRPHRVAVRRRTARTSSPRCCKLAEDRDEVNVVADQIGCPTFTGHLAPALVEIAEQRLTGILHVAGGGQCSWHELAQADVRGGRHRHCTASPVTTAEFPRPAPRPAVVRPALHPARRARAAALARRPRPPTSNSEVLQ